MSPPDTTALTAQAEAPSATLAPFASRAQLSALFELTKPSVTTLVMVTMVSGAFAASVRIQPLQLVLAMFATACVVGAANAFNMWMERDTDMLMSRTRRAGDDSQLAGRAFGLGRAVLVRARLHAAQARDHV